MTEDRAVSRRSVLTTLGAAAAAAVLHSSIGAAQGGKGDSVVQSVYGLEEGRQSGKWMPKDLMNMDYCIAVTVQQLRAETSPDPGCMYFVTDVGREGPFIYDPADTTSADNTGTLLVSASGARFKRIFEGPASVVWFGAKGDGVTDDTAAIQNAIDHEDSIAIPDTASNTYLISDTIRVHSDKHIEISRGVSLKLRNNANKTMIQNSDTVNGNSNISITGGKFDANKANQAGGPDFAAIQLTKVTDSFFQNMVVTGNKFAAYHFGSAGWDMLECDRNRIYDCELSEADGEGLWLRESSYNEIVGGEYHHNAGSGIAINRGEFNRVERVYAHHAGQSNLSINASHSRIINNLCDTNGANHGITFGHQGYPADYSLCSGNVCRNHAGNGIAFLGSTIEAVCVHNRCTNNGESGIRVSDLSKEITVAENTVTNNRGAGIYILGSSASPEAQCTLSGNTCKGNGADGIFLLNAHNCGISNNTCTGNLRHGIWLNGVNTKYNSITGNRCCDNQAVKTQQRGIYVDGTKNSLIGNMLMGNRDHPYVASPGNTVRDNTLSNTDDTSAVVTLNATSSTVYANGNIRTDSRIVFHPMSVSASGRNAAVASIASGSVTFLHDSGGAGDQIRVCIG